MKRIPIILFCVYMAAAARAELPSYSGWPRCAPILGFSAEEIGVAALESITTPKPEQRWVCLAINRDTGVVAAVSETSFDERFPGVRAAGNRGESDCHEVIKPVPPAASGVEPPACIDTKVLCGSTEVPVSVGATVAKIPCAGRIFSAATLIDGQVWAALNPLDIYYRELAGSGLVVQPVKGAPVARRTSAELGGRSLCAVRADPFGKRVWATTENGLVALSPAGKVLELLKFNGSGRPMSRRSNQ